MSKERAISWRGRCSCFTINYAVEPENEDIAEIMGWPEVMGVLLYFTGRSVNITKIITI
jgi:hypothetical protein